MSIDHESPLPRGTFEAPTTLDISGLPASVAAELRNLVATLRASFPATREPGSVPTGESSDEWARRLQEWIDSHPVRDIVIDDDRETIYAGRGE